MMAYEFGYFQGKWSCEILQGWFNNIKKQKLGRYAYMITTKGKSGDFQPKSKSHNNLPLYSLPHISIILRKRIMDFKWI